MWWFVVLCISFTLYFIMRRYSKPRSRVVRKRHSTGRGYGLVKRKKNTLFGIKLSSPYNLRFDKEPKVGPKIPLPKPRPGGTMVPLPTGLPGGVGGMSVNPTHNWTDYLNPLWVINDAIEHNNFWEGLGGGLEAAAYGGLTLASLGLLPALGAGAGVAAGGIELGELGLLGRAASAAGTAEESAPFLYESGAGLFNRGGFKYS